jgi:hypothetical protein
MSEPNYESRFILEGGSNFKVVKTIKYNRTDSEIK